MTTEYPPTYNNLMFISENYCPISSPNSDRSRIDNPLAMLRDHNGNGVIEADEVFIFTKDHLNSVRELTDHNQKLIQRYNYSAYGKTKIERIAGGADIRFVENYFTHAAREWEIETSDQFHKHRFRNEGRWLSEDPIGFDGGDGNLYNTFKNNPIINTDPDGLYSKSDAAEMGSGFLSGAGANSGAGGGCAGEAAGIAMATFLKSTIGPAFVSATIPVTAGPLINYVLVRAVSGGSSTKRDKGAESSGNSGSCGCPGK